MDEVARLVRVLGQVNGGVFELAEEDASLAAGSPEQAEYRERLTRLVLETGVPVTYGVSSTRQMPYIDEVAAAGGRLFGLSHSRGIAIVLSFKTRLPFDSIPEWRDIRSEPLARQKEMLTDPAMRQMLVRAAHGPVTTGGAGPTPAHRATTA